MSSWELFGWNGNGAIDGFAGIALLNGGLRRAYWERQAWREKQHTRVTQRAVLQGIASSSSNTMLDMSQQDFMGFVNTLPEEQWYATKWTDAYKYWGGKFQTVPMSDNKTSDRRFILDRLPSSWTDNDVSVAFLEESGLLYYGDDGNLRNRNLFFMPQSMAYPYCRMSLDAWRWVGVSICPWMLSVDIVNSTVTASAELRSICSTGCFVTSGRTPSTSTKYKYGMTQTVALQDSTSMYLELWLDGYSFLNFVPDEESEG